jgi:YihY family inner membrane protein
MSIGSCHKLSETPTDAVRLGIANTWDIIRDAANNYERNSDVNQAAAIAFYAILSLIPFFLLTLLAAGYVLGTYPHIQKDIAETVKSIHPFFSEDILDQLVKVEEKKPLLGWVGIISLIWFSSMIFGALEKAFNIIFRTKILRNFVESKLLAFAMILLGWVVGVTSMGIAYLASAVEKQTLMTTGGFFANGSFFLSRYFLPYLLTIAFTTLVFMIIPRGKVSLQGAAGGAVIFSTMMEAAKHFFAWYITHYTHYDVIFGPMEAVVLLVIWVFYVSIILLFCAEMISSYERRDLILLEGAFLKPGNKALKTDERLFHKFGRFYPKWSYLFREGDTGDNMFYILNGKVGVKKEVGQASKTLAEIGPGSYLGEMAALIDAPRTASAQVIEDSHVAVISGNMFRNVLRESEGVSLFMLREFSNRIIHTNTELEKSTQAWIKLLVALYFVREWPLPKGMDPLAELATLTGKETIEIKEVLDFLSKEGIILIEDDTIVGFRKERIGDLLKAV